MSLIAAPAAPGLSADALVRLQAAQAKAAAPASETDGTAVSAIKAKAHAAAQDFEAVFLGSMFKEMLTGVDGEGPFGGTQGVGVWRSFLTDQFAKSYAKAGGIGIAAHVYDTLLKQQGVRS